MMRASARSIPCTLAAAGALSMILAVPGSTAGQDRSERTATPVEEIRWLLEEVDRLTDENERLRRALAEAQVEAREIARDRDELRHFIEDNEQLADDFVNYREVRAVAEREARQRVAQANRERFEAERAARLARAQELRERREAENAEERRLDRYRSAGFGAIGLDVFASRMAYSYETRETNPVRIDYDPWLGLYYRPGGPTQEIDFGRMTISGSVLNALDTVRNIGIAVTFFDEEGNQVGAEIVRINNARRDVPYPFTSTVDMALDRPFSSASTYVLYADEIE